MRIILINLCSFVAVQCVSVQPTFGLSPELNSPRIGDELTLQELRSVVVTQNPDTECVDLSKAVVSSESEFKVLATAKEDTLTAMLVVTGNRNLGLATGADGNLYRVRTYQPGQKRAYSSHIPYINYSDTTKVEVIESTGLISRIGKFTTTGAESSQLTRNTKLVTIDGNTLSNVECLRTGIDEEFIYESGDTVRHIGVQNQWYVPGYRYPALTYTADTMISQEGDTIDYVSRWEAIDLSHQEETIKGDEVNECLREILQEYSYTNMYVNHTEIPGDGSFRRGNIEWDARTKTITVLPTLNEPDAPTDYILCDAYGRVFDEGEIDTAEPIQISLVSRPRGVYVFALYNDEVMNTIKITKR